MGLRRWDPPELATLREQMNRLWDTLRTGTREAAAPRIDTEDEVITVAELPGVPSKERRRRSSRHQGLRLHPRGNQSGA